MFLAIGASVLAGVVIGWVYGQGFNRFGIPTFVITLAGLLGFLGLQLYVLGANGSINLPFESGLVNFAQLAFVPRWLSYVLAVLTAAAFFDATYGRARERRTARLSARPLLAIALQSAVMLVLLLAAVWFLNRGRGVGWMFVLFGGRGTAYSALLGVLVLQSISSGLTLLNLSSSFRFMVTGMVLVLAVGLDSVSRRSRSAHGRA